jgi:imidazolonepropionase-like amidohydrolase
MNRCSVSFGAVAVALLCLLTGASGVAREKEVKAGAAANPAPLLLIRNATILTVTHGTLEKGDILIKDGKIAAVGSGLQAPADALVIDASGQFVMPGIIDCHSHIAIDGDVNEGSVSVSSMVNIADVLNSDDPAIYRDLAGGVTAANILHGSANSIGGQTVVIKLRWGQPAAKLPFEGALPGIKFALGENPKRSNFRVSGMTDRYPATRMGVEETIRGAFTEARDYKMSWDDYNKRVAAGEKNLIPPRRDLKLDPLVEVLEGKRYVHAHCYREDEILMLLRVAKEFGFRVQTLQHVLEGYKVAPEIAAHGVGAGTFVDWWGFKAEAIDAIPYNVALMTRKGVLSAVNSDSDELARRLNLEAAKTMKYGGLSEEEALKTCTINGARQLGLESRIGSLEVGKDADVVIWNGPPLSTYSRVETTMIEGVTYFDRQRDLGMRLERAKEKRERLARERAEESKQKKLLHPRTKTDDDEPGAAPGEESAASGTQTRVSAQQVVGDGNE